MLKKMMSALFATALLTTPAMVSAQAAKAPAKAAAAGEDYSKYRGNAATGRKYYAQCAACHVQTPGVNRVGPSLHNIVGREAGTVPGFRYSKANRDSHVIWTEAKLFQYLKNPRAMIKGTTMAYAGLPDPQRRADLIAFLKTNGKP